MRYFVESGTASTGAMTYFILMGDGRILVNGNLRDSAFISDVFTVSIQLLTYHANMSMQCRPLYTSLLHSRMGFTGVYRVIHYLFYFCSKT